MDAVYLAATLPLAGHSSAGLLSYDVRQRAGLAPEDHVALLPA